MQQVTQGANTTENYTYDKVGNRLTSLGVATYSYNNSNQLTSADGTSFTYDHNGNTTSKTDTNGQTTYAWDFENRLTSVTTPTALVTFKYDPFGRRIQKSSTSGTATYVYDGANGIEELNGSGAVSARYVQGAGIDEPLAQSGSALSYYDGDGLGSITSLTDATGTPAATFVYGAFGVLSSSSGTTANSYRYTAREYDQETGLYYYRARYYDSSIGTFLSMDPLGLRAGTNLYDYVVNDPVSLVDPKGLLPRPVPSSRAKTRPCDSEEYSECANLCRTQGKTVQSCRVSQTFRVTRWTEGKTLWEWADGPLSCSCNELRKCDPVLREQVGDWLHDRWRELDRYMSTPHIWWWWYSGPGATPQTNQ